MSDDGRQNAPGMELTRHELALLALLRRYEHNRALPEEARQAIRWATGEWHLGRAVPDVLHDRTDAVARLAVVRVELLRRLQAIAPPGAIDGTLIWNGDWTALGWCDPVRAALDATTATPRVATAPENPAPAAWDVADASEKPARAPHLWGFTSDGRSVTIGCTVPHVGGGLHCDVGRGSNPPLRRRMSGPAWRGLLACCAGLHLLADLPIGRDARLETGRELAAAAATLCGSGVWWPEELVRQRLVELLADIAPAGMVAQRTKALARDLQPGASTALVVQGLDVIAGTRMFPRPLMGGPLRADRD